MDDRTLWERLIAGDAHAAAAFYDRFAPDVNRLIWRLLGADDDHDDLVQQVFCKLLEGARGLRNPETLRPWVQTVTVNAVHSELRRRRVRRFWSRDVANADDHAGLNATPEARDLLRRVYEILRRMPPEEHVAFVLHHVDERPVREVAELTHCSAATVKRRIARARERISEIAGKDGDLQRLIEGGTR